MPESGVTRLTVALWKPGADALIRYAPPGTPGALNSPRSSVDVFSISPVDSDFTTTVADRIPAPLASVTAPWRRALSRSTKLFRLPAAMSDGVLDGA